MTDTPIPPDAGAQIERAIAEMELALIRAHQAPVEAPAFVFRLGPSLETLASIALGTLGQIVRVVSTLPWTAEQRRALVERYQHQVVTRCELDRAPRGYFLAALHKQAWWVEFLETLRGLKRADVPSIAVQLQALLDEAQWTKETLAEAVGLKVRAVYRHFSGTVHALKSTTKTAYERAFTTKLGREITIINPPRPARARRSRKKSSRSR